jgi:Rap1a immunity proteins
LGQRIAVALGAICVLVSPAMAVEPSNFNAGTTRDLVELCSDEPGDPLYVEAKQFCYGFLAGVAQFHGAMVQGDKIQPLACPKDAVTREQLVGVFLDWAKANPQSMDELPVESLERATAARWPCDSRSAAAPLRSPSGER